MSLSLTNIPAIMRHHGWTVGASLMEKWLARPASVSPAYSQVDRDTVTVDWSLGFDRARSVYDDIISSRVWANSASATEIRNMLIRKGISLTPSFGAGTAFDFSSEDGQDVDADYINFRAVNYTLSFDDLGCALGRFTYRIVVAGQVGYDAVDDITNVIITKVGIYIKDSYDFNGDQALGCWNDSTNYVGLSATEGDPVTNESFRDWRTSNGNGGDFMIYSKVKVIDLVNPDLVRLPAGNPSLR